MPKCRIVIPPCPAKRRYTEVISQSTIDDDDQMQACLDIAYFFRHEKAYVEMWNPTFDCWVSVDQEFVTHVQLTQNNA